MTEREEIVRKGYGKIAKEYQTNRHIFDNRKELEDFVSLLPKNAMVLDVGCGAGVPVAKFLVNSGFDVTGIDFSESMLRLARKNVPKARLIKKGMTWLGFKDTCFDGLTAFYSLIHVPREKHSSLLQNFQRILKTNGIMLVCMGGDRWEGEDEYYGAKMFWSHYDPEKSLQLVKDTGYKLCLGNIL